MADSRTANQLRKRLEQISKGIVAGAEQYASIVALRTRDVVADRTPIDTGRASGSWNLSVGQPDPSTLPENFNTDRDASISLNAPFLGRVDIAGFSLGVPFWVSNNVDYIGFLEAGSSRQAPSGMVDITMSTIARQAGAIPFSIKVK